MAIDEKLISSLREMDMALIDRPVELGRYNLGQYGADFNYIKDKLLWCVNVASKFPDKISELLEKQLADIIKNFSARYDATKNFKIDTLGGSNVQDAFKKIKDLNDRFLTRALSNMAQNDVGLESNFLSVCNRFKDIEEENSEKKDYNKIISDAEIKLNDLSKHSSDAARLLSELEKRSSLVATTDYAEIFEKEARKYYRWSKQFPFIGGSQLWLIAGIVCLIMIALFLIYGSFEEVKPLLSKDSVPLSLADALARFIPHLIVISLLLFLVRFSFKQYSVSRHLYTLNIHRANILRSFKLFIEGDDQPEIKNALLLEVAKAIHSVGATGYVDDKTPEINFPILEVLKAVTTK